MNKIRVLILVFIVLLSTSLYAIQCCKFNFMRFSTEEKAQDFCNKINSTYNYSTAEWTLIGEGCDVMTGNPVCESTSGLWKIE